MSKNIVSGFWINHGWAKQSIENIDFYEFLAFVHQYCSFRRTNLIHTSIVRGNQLQRRKEHYRTSRRLCMDEARLGFKPTECSGALAAKTSEKKINCYHCIASFEE
uniref:PiggyBac transposable element-derived protein domain-containing protein n=1 Tax=Megaselia scalaris TaxID=36166 RepID=T1GFY3_MEGSC